MFCIQCEQTMVTPMSKGCSFAQGMCGKTAEVSDLQDILVKYLQGISFWAHIGRSKGIIAPVINRWCSQAFFSTLTNVNFDKERIYTFIQSGQKYRKQLEQEVIQVITDSNEILPPLIHAAALELPLSIDELIQFAPQIALNADKAQINEDILGLRLLCLYGLKGVAAYMEHAAVLGQTSDEIYAEYHRIMSFLGDQPTDTTLLLETSLQIGTLNYQVMTILDKGETSRFGDPSPNKVNIAPVKGHCILVSGHDLEDLYEILVQTEGKNINVYTHGEMLPAHGYPKLKAFPHLVGNYGTAWQNQQKEFAQFPGAIVMTSNCIINPNVGRYKDRIFTRSIVGWPGAKHIEHNDFSEVIQCALNQEGFKTTEMPHEITVGFGRAALANAAPLVIDEIKKGNIKHFFLVGGCDGDKKERNYYTDFALQTPKDTVMLTLACGKYRFNHHNFGDINGIPRLLDVGQCNDTYSAIQLALSLANVFNCGVNDLPLTLVISWFEQKAIAVLLTLLSLGIKGIYLGPTTPAFLTENLVNILVETYDIHLTNTPEEDINIMLKK